MEQLSNWQGEKTLNEQLLKLHEFSVSMKLHFVAERSHMTKQSLWMIKVESKEIAKGFVFIAAENLIGRSFDLPASCVVAGVMAVDVKEAETLPVE